MEKVDAEGIESAEGAEIIALGPEEWERVKELRREAVRKEPKAFGDTPEEAKQMTEVMWRERLEKGQYLFARIGGRIVGMAALVPKEGEKNQHIANIFSFYVEEGMRGRGIGKQLLTAIIEKARQNTHIRKLRLRVSATQPAAMHVYEELGFEKTHFYKGELNVNGEMVDEWEMERELL